MFEFIVIIFVYNSYFEYVVEKIGNVGIIFNLMFIENYLKWGSVWYVKCEE